MNKTPKHKNTTFHITARVKGMTLIVLAIILLLSYLFYVFKYIGLYNKMNQNINIHIPYKADNFFLGIPHFFFDKIGILSFLLCHFLFAYGRYYLRRKKRFKALRRLSLLLLFWILYGNILLGFLTPRYIFPYSGILGKKIVVALINNIGFSPTFLLIFLLIPLLSRFFWIRIRKKTTITPH